ncbi:MAG: chemotaxis protein CheR [Desulfuromonadaceae bacterium]|nr:chemotaxis protein CheR [Desulfuromonadaceae bacterium]
MPSVTSGVSAESGPDGFETMFAPIDRDRFQYSVRRLQSMFRIYATTSPEPLPAPGLIITPEIRTQCERYLPVTEVAAVFNLLYSAALTYSPILSSTPFHNSLSWADTFASLSPPFQFSANPALLLKALLGDRDLLTRFLFASFLPGRFYGGIGRYPGQQRFVRNWLKRRRGGMLRILDAACGTGEETFGLALRLSELGFSPDKAQIDGWTVEPLEVWVATHIRFPHDPKRESVMKGITSVLHQHGYGQSISFRCRDILASLENRAEQRGIFDLILCNGLLGGPIIHEKEQLDRAVGNLAGVLAPGGVLLAADNFHGGWKQKCPQSNLRASFETHGLVNVEISEGIGGLKPD